MEERVTDQQTGRILNPDMEFYKLAGIADIGDIVVHMDIRPEMDKRGVIGLGRTARDRRHCGHRECSRERHRRARSDGPGDAIPGARRTGREERIMQAFEYANPTTLQEAFKLARRRTGARPRFWPAEPTCISLMKDDLVTPKRLVNIKNIKELGGITTAGGGLRIGATVTLRRTRRERRVRKHSRADPGRCWAWPARRSATWGRPAATCASVRDAGTTGPASGCSR